MPVTENCFAAPAAIDGFAGVTISAVRLPPVTVTFVEPETPPRVAVIVAVPAATPVIAPVEFTVAIPVLVEDQLAEALISCDVPSVKVPVAVSAFVTPEAMLGLLGVMAIAVGAAAVTDRVVDPATPPEVAVMVVDPGAIAVAKPELLMLAVAVSLDDQVADDETSLDVPSE